MVHLTHSHVREMELIGGREQPRGQHDVDDVGNGLFARPVALELGRQRNPADGLRACLEHALEPGTVRFGRRTSDRVDNGIDLIPLRIASSDGKARHTSVHSAVMINFLRPVASTAPWKSTFSHELISVRSISALSERTALSSGIVGP